jgi:hypothetical protein
MAIHFRRQVYIDRDFHAWEELRLLSTSTSIRCDTKVGSASVTPYFSMKTCIMNTILYIISELQRLTSDPLGAIFMKVVLVNPPRSDSDTSELAPPLGLLRLAATARELDCETSIVDLNLLWHLDTALRQDFYEQAVNLLLRENGDLYGFTSMAVDSHVGIQLASQLKEIRPETKIVLGGPHFSSIANEIKARFNWVEEIVIGEGEEKLSRIIAHLRGNETLEELTCGDQEPQIKEFNTAFPAYELVDLSSYFHVNPRHTFDHEGGRGCVFKCAFCYSPFHFPNVRSFRIEQRLSEINALVKLGAKHLFFVEDNFLNDPATATLFCRELAACRVDLEWSCYATLPLLTDEIIQEMAASGCCSVFCGIDAVGWTSQHAYRKKFVKDLDSLLHKIRQCAAVGIVPTCAFLLAPPSHPCGKDFEQTIALALAVRNAGAHVRLNTLTLYNQTPAEAANASGISVNTTKVKLLLDVPAVVEDNPYANSMPSLFPFHSTYVGRFEWETFLQRVHCLFTLLFAVPGELGQLAKNRDFNFAKFADSLLVDVGSLFSIQKPDRRYEELNAFRCARPLPKTRSQVPVSG